MKIYNESHFRRFDAEKTAQKVVGALGITSIGALFAVTVFLWWS